MKKKIGGTYLRFVLNICVFCMLFLLSGKTQTEAAQNYTVKFNNIAGTSSHVVYSRLNKTVAKNTYITLPKIVETPGYKNMGWSLKKGDKSTYLKIGSKYKVTKNVTFYLVKEKRQYVTASFRNNSGGTNAAYEKLGKKVEKGTSFVLPSAGTVKGYVNMGWTTAKGKSTPLYKIGAKYTMTQNRVFYIVRKRLYTVSFADTNGDSSRFGVASRSAASGGSITLPKAPAKEGYVCIGWSTKINDSAAAYLENASYKVSKNCTLYAVYKPKMTIKFMNQDGSSEIKTVSVGQGTSTRLIGYWQSGYTMMGWSTQPGQRTQAQYEVGQKVTVKGNLVLYAVLFARGTEVNYDINTMPQVDTRRYTKVILVGDSRTVLLGECMQEEFPAAVLNGMSFVGKRGSGLAWLKTTGVQNLMKEIGTGGTVQKPIAVVFNSGVNDVKSVSSYISFMRELAPKLKEKNCKLFYMSVNPVNNVVLKRRGLDVPEEYVSAFNSKIKASLCASDGAYSYIDTYSELYKSGFTHDSGKNVDDGLHYTKQTYKYIYAYMVRALNKR